jgi:hypothetical protein
MSQLIFSSDSQNTTSAMRPQCATNYTAHHKVILSVPYGCSILGSTINQRTNRFRQYRIRMSLLDVRGSNFSRQVKIFENDTNKTKQIGPDQIPRMRAATPSRILWLPSPFRCLRYIILNYIHATQNIKINTRRRTTVSGVELRVSHRGRTQAEDILA